MTNYTRHYKAYLTIDDSPSNITDELLAYLNERQIQALFFCRGDHLENNPTPIINAIFEGHIIGNHLYSHKRASKLELDQLYQEITSTEKLIEKAYKTAGTPRPIKTIRFPYTDRGLGARWFSTHNDHNASIIDIIETGLGNNFAQEPSVEDISKFELLQEFLKHEGFTTPHFNELPDDCWYKKIDHIQNAYDTLFTCSSSDWMLTQRHLKKDWPYKTTQHLINAMMNDFQRQDTHILLMHDQGELKNCFKEVIDGMRTNGVEFLQIT